MNTTYDVIIIGSGPAGFTAATYTTRANLKTLIIAGRKWGGQLMLTTLVENFPGFPDGIQGPDLMMAMRKQAEHHGAEIAEIDFTNGDFLRYPFTITAEDKTFQAKAIILATGTERRKLNIPGEVEYTGKGVHYCATCERMEYDGKICVVVGGGNSAVQAAVELADAAKKVYIIYRGTELRGESVWLERIKKSHNIEVIYSTAVLEIVGNGKKITHVILSETKNPIRDSQNREDSSSRSSGIQDDRNKILPIDKIFIEIGGVPGSALIIPLGIKINTVGYIEVNEKLGTNVPGVFACGDLVSSGLSIEQIATAIGLGARAAASAFAYIKGEKTPTVWGKSQIRR